MSLPLYVDGAVVTYSVITGTLAPAALITLDGASISTVLPSTVLSIPTVTGVYLISASIRLMVPASGGHKPTSTIGPISLAYTCGDSNLPVTDILITGTEAGVAGTTNSGNAVGNSLCGSAIICAKSGQSLNVSIGYTSQGTIPMSYTYHVRAVFIGGIPT